MTGPEASTDVAPFLDRLAESIPGWPDNLPASWLGFRAQCEARERAGRERFGDRYKHRDNALEGGEEWADGANYMHFDVLAEGEADIDCALMAAWHSYMAWCYAMRRREKRLGTP